MRDCMKCEDVEQRELIRLQRDMLEDVARGRSLKGTMTNLCRQAETLSSGAVCSILIVTDGRRLKTLAAPSLPSQYSRAIDGLEIGPGVGSCGSAAYHGKSIVTSDIGSDPNWIDFRRLAMPLGLHACWSTPIFGQDGDVLGTFAFYFREARGPNKLEKSIVQACVRICSIAIEREQARTRLKRLAYSDPLTGIANRAGFLKRLERTFSRASLVGPCAAADQIAVVVIEVAGLTQVNNDLGHAIGDRLLIFVAGQLRWQARRSSLVARVSGGKFAILFQKGNIKNEVAKFAGKLATLFARPLEIDARRLWANCRIGVAIAPQHGDDFETLLRAGESALRDAKNMGGQPYRLYDSGRANRERELAALECDLRQAIADGAIELHYQPFFELSSSRIAGFEALARWTHPRLGPVSPLDFISLAEQTGLILDLGVQLMRKACREAAAWPNALRLAVNVSALHLRAPGFAAELAILLAETRLPPWRLELELTETVLLADDPSIQTALRNLKSLGVAIAIDDFGTGYSALSYLHKFPVDRLKIDRSFVSDMMEKSRDRTIVGAILNLAHELGIMTTAEGVETVQQLEWLRHAGCSEAQGYLLGRPVAQPAQIARKSNHHEYRATG